MAELVPSSGTGPSSPKAVVRSTPSAAASPQEVLAAVQALREDMRDEAALGDGSSLARNINVSDAAAALRELLAVSRENGKLAVEYGAVQALVFALEQRPNSEAVQSQATKTLGHLAASSSENLTFAGEAGGVRAVVAALRGHPNSEVVQESATEALGLLVSSGFHNNQVLAKEAGGIDAVIVALRQHLGSHAVQRSATAALSNLVVENQENQQWASKAGAIDAVLFVLKEHATNEQVQEHAVEATARLVSQSLENQTLAREVGIISAILVVLKKHRKSKIIQTNGLSALRDLVVDNCENQKLAGKEGALGAAQAALKHHPNDDAVQELACEALAYCVMSCQANQKFAREAGLIESVISLVLGRHPISASLLAKASRALGNLVAGNPDSQRLAGEAGGIKYITTGLKKHLDSDTVRERASEALGHLVSRNPQNQEFARKAGSIEVMLQALRHQPTSISVQAQALSALRSLILCRSANTKAAVLAGGIDEVIAALKQHCKGDAEHGPAPASPSRGSQFQRMAREAGVIEATIESLKIPPKGASAIGPHMVKLLGYLRDLVIGCYESQKLGAEAGGIDAVVLALKEHPRNDTVQEQAARVLYAFIAENAANQRRAKDAAADESLLHAQTLHPASPMVQEATNLALDALGSGERFAKEILETDYGKKLQTCTSIPDPALRGVSLEQLVELQEFIQGVLLTHDIEEKVSSDGLGTTGVGARGRSLEWETVSMYQVKDHFMLPLTRETKCSFAEVASSEKQPPMWMVSHWWGTPFVFTIRMLQLQSKSRHLHGASSVSYWCDAFANNLHDRTAVDEADILQSAFARAMMSQACMGTVLLCDPEVTPLLRTWCVFEAHVTQLLRSGKLSDITDKKSYFLDILAPVEYTDPSNENRKEVTITMLQDAVGGSWNEVSDTEGVFFPLDIAHAGVEVDVLKAQASDEADRAAILNFLSNGVGSKDPPPEAHMKYDEMNKSVHKVFASAELYRVASEQREACVEQAVALIELRADVNSFVRQGCTPLFAAAGADPAAPPSADSTAQRVDLLEVLLAARADVNHASAGMKTVLDCAVSLSDEARGLLMRHGAKTYADAAPDLERTANAQLSQILASGFGSELQAFIGGDAGTRLCCSAERALQAAAAILKLYHWAPCRIGIQAGRRHQAQLAGERAQSVRLALESAGCRNALEVRFGAQPTLLTLTISLAPTDPQPGQQAIAPVPPKVGHNFTPAPPTGGYENDRRLATALGSERTWHPAQLRSPEAVLPLRTSPTGISSAGGFQVSRLPRVSLPDQPRHAVASRDSGRSPKMPIRNRATSSSLGDTWPHADGENSNALDSSLGTGLPQLVPAGRPSHTLRQAGLVGGRRVAWSQASPNGLLQSRSSGSLTLSEVNLLRQSSPSGIGPSPTSPLGIVSGSRANRGGTGSQPPTPSEGPTPRGQASFDLDSLAGSRWFQTSITCSISPTHGHSTENPPNGGSTRAASCGRIAEARRGNGTPPGTLSSLPVVAGRRSVVDTEAPSCPSPSHNSDGRPPTRGGSDERPSTRGGTRPKAAEPETSPSAAAPGNLRVTATTGNRDAGLMCNRSTPALRRCGGLPAGGTQGAEPPRAARTHSLSTFGQTGTVQRSSSRVFSVSDLMD